MKGPLPKMGNPFKAFFPSQIIRFKPKWNMFLAQLIKCSRCCVLLSQATSKNYVTAQLSCTVIMLWASSDCNLSLPKNAFVSKELSFPKEITYIFLLVGSQMARKSSQYAL